MFVSIFGGGPHFAADLCARWLPTTSNANFNGYHNAILCDILSYHPDEIVNYNVRTLQNASSASGPK